MDGKSFFITYLATQEASKQLGRMFPFVLYAPSSFLVFLDEKARILDFSPFLFSSLIPLPSVFFLD
jgi:hypothetical protein